MMKLAICNETFQGWDFQRTCDYSAQIGYDGLEIAPFTLADSVEEITSQRRNELANCIERSGLECVGLHWLLAAPKGLYINHPDRMIRDKTVDYLKALIRFCADLDGKILVFGSPKQRSVHPELKREDAWKYAAEGFHSVMPEAESAGITIAFEPLTAAETDFINSAQEAVQLINEVDHPRFRLHLDVKAMSAESMPVVEVISANAGYLAHFHANDPNRRGPGFGDVDFAPIVKALKDVAYSGYLSVEVFDYSPDPETIATQSLAYLKRFL